jgi:integrase
LDRPRNRQAPPQSIHHGQGRTHLRSGAQSLQPKTEGVGKVGQILIALASKAQQPFGHTVRAARLIIAYAGNSYPAELSAAHAFEVNSAISESGWAHSTRRNTASEVSRIFWWLAQYHGAPDLSPLIEKHPGLRPRNTVASEAEKEALLAAAPAYLRLWLLLCSDLAIRSGTAARLAPEHYDTATRDLTFTTKYGARQTMPVTQEIAALIARCSMQNAEPFTLQLHRAEPHKFATPADFTKQNNQNCLQYNFRTLRRRIGINRSLTPHDFRRTTAVRLYQHTHDARDVQALLGHRSLASTIWYLDHDLRPVNRATLELIKRPHAAESEEPAA